LALLSSPNLSTSGFWSPLTTCYLCLLNIQKVTLP
jgi:hypothetical protein